VLGEMTAGQQDTAIPREMLGRARAIGVFPQVKKGAVIVGGRYGQGVLSVKRAADGHWSAPAFFTVAAAASACSWAAR
jgi:lipid-binding SYLF domain-containing protein